MSLETSSSAEALPAAVSSGIAQPAHIRDAAGNLPIDDTLLQRALAMAAEMFSCVPEVETMHDPDDPRHSFIVVTVWWNGTPPEVVAKSLEWHERVAIISPSLEALRLTIYPARHGCD
jgi:hypothetical protein